MIRACLFLLAGMYAPQLTSFAIDSDLGKAISVAACVSLALHRLRLLGWFLAGAALFLSAAHDVVDSRIAAELVGDSIVARIRIAGFPGTSGPSVTFVGVPVNDARLPARMRLSWFEPPVSLHPGDTWQLELRLRRPRGMSNPGVFDYEQWLFREAFGAVGYVVDSHRNHLLDSGAPGAVEAVRQRFVTRVSQIIPEPAQAAVLAALVVGTRHLLSHEQWDRYARTGTSHLMAISGLHIGLAAGAGYIVVCCFAGILRCGGNLHRAGVVGSLIVAALYTLISGVAIPARRASLMIAITGLVLLRRRVPRPPGIVCGVCIAVAIAAPLATMAPGFKLSFAAVGILLWLARRYQHDTRTRSRLRFRPANAIRQLANVQLLLLLGLLPVTVLLFGRIAFPAPAVNFVAVPVFSLVTVPFALTGFLLDGPLHFAGDKALLVAAYSIGLIEDLIAVTAIPPWAAPAISAIAATAWLYVILPVVWVVAPPGWPGRHVTWVAVAAVILYVPRAPGFGCVDMHVLDVGQGLAAIVQTERHVLLFDTGPSFRGGGSTAHTIVLPYLASRGIKRIDWLVVSHADLDHAGGVPALVGNIEVGKILSGEPLPGTEALRHDCRAGEHWRLDGVGFGFLHPPSMADYAGNNASCVLQIQAGPRRLLLTGDIERPVENQLVQNGVLDRVDAVVVPHHGSGTSSSPPFVRTLSPSVAIVAAGFGNRWGFPKQDVVERWKAAGAEVLVTATSGAISVGMCSSAPRISVRNHRQERHRIWHE